MIANGAPTSAPIPARTSQRRGWQGLASTGKHVVPQEMRGNSSLVGSAPYGAWGKITNSAPQSLTGVTDVARNGFALITCAGCHRHETNTAHFTHVSDVRAIDEVDRAAVGVTASTPARAVILSNFLRSNFLRREINPPVANDEGSGVRYQDFTELLESAKAKAPKVPAHG